MSSENRILAEKSYENALEVEKTLCNGEKFQRLYQSCCLLSIWLVCHTFLGRYCNAPSTLSPAPVRTEIVSDLTTIRWTRIDRETVITTHMLDFFRSRARNQLCEQHLHPKSCKMNNTSSETLAMNTHLKCEEKNCRPTVRSWFLLAFVELQRCRRSKGWRKPYRSSTPEAGNLNHRK